MIGWKATAPNVGGSGLSGSNGYFKFDSNGNGGYKTAAESGGPSTSFGSNSDAGDYQIETSPNFFNEYRVVNFRFRDSLSASAYPLQGETASAAFTIPAGDLPFRAFGIDESGTSGSSSERLSSQLLLLNVTDLNASTFNSTGVNAIGSTIPFYIQQGNVDGSTGAFVVAPVPEPSAVALTIASALGFMIWRKRSRRIAD